MKPHKPVLFTRGEGEAVIVRRVLERDGRIDTIDAFEHYRITRLALPIDALRKAGMHIRTDKRAGREGKALYVWEREKDDFTPVAESKWPPMACKRCGESRRLGNIQPTVDPRWYFVECGVCGSQQIAETLPRSEPPAAVG